MYLKETIKSDKVFQPRSLIFLMYSVVKALSKRKAKGDFAERSISVFGDKLQVTFLKDNLTHTNSLFSFMTLAQKWRVCELSQLLSIHKDHTIISSKAIYFWLITKPVWNSTVQNTTLCTSHIKKQVKSREFIDWKGIFLVCKSIISLTVEWTVH